MGHIELTEALFAIELGVPLETTDKALLEQALAQLRMALQLLDNVQAAREIGAHVDLAICRLEEVLGQGIPRRAPSAWEH